MGPDDRPPPYVPAPYAPPPLPHAPYGQVAHQGGPLAPYGYQQTAPYPPPPGAYQQHVPYPIGIMQPQGTIHHQNYGTVVIPPHMLPTQPGAMETMTPSVVTLQPAENIILVGGCPACRIGVLEDDYTCGGILMAIIFFPIGFLCCIAMKQRKCPNCGASFA